MHLNKTAWYFLPALHCVHQALNNDKKNSPGQVFFAVILCFQRAMQIKKSGSFFPVASVLVPEVVCLRLD